MAGKWDFLSKSPTPEMQVSSIEKLSTAKHTTGGIFSSPYPGSED